MNNLCSVPHCMHQHHGIIASNSNVVDKCTCVKVTLQMCDNKQLPLTQADADAKLLSHRDRDSCHYSYASFWIPDEPAIQYYR